MTLQNIESYNIYVCKQIFYTFMCTHWLVQYYQKIMCWLFIFRDDIKVKTFLETVNVTNVPIIIILGVHQTLPFKNEIMNYMKTRICSVNKVRDLLTSRIHIMWILGFSKMLTIEKGNPAIYENDDLLRK